MGLVRIRACVDLRWVRTGPATCNAGIIGGTEVGAGAMSALEVGRDMLVVGRDMLVVRRDMLVVRRDASEIGRGVAVAAVIGSRV
jgi:hypothetical protein